MQRSRFSYLNQRVLTPSVKELNQKSDWYITLNTIKKGRAVYMLHFEFSPKAQQKLFDDVKQVKPGKIDNSRERRAKVTAAIMDIGDTNW